MNKSGFILLGLFRKGFIFLSFANFFALTPKKNPYLRSVITCNFYTFKFKKK
jgi:hypothetical protein